MPRLFQRCKRFDYWEALTVSWGNNRLWEWKGHQGSPGPILTSKTTLELSWGESRLSVITAPPAAPQMCQQSSAKGACSAVCPPTPEDDVIGESGVREKMWDSVVGLGDRSPPFHSSTTNLPPPLNLRIKPGAIKCKSGQTAPPWLVGEFVLKWKWGWCGTWWLAPRLTWKERKRQLLIFSFDLWLLLVFHTNVDLWRSLTTNCY